MVLFGYGIPLEYCKITGTVTRSEKSINLQCKQVVLIALSISFIMRHLGSVKSSRTNLLAFAGLAAMLMTTACGNGPTGPTGPNQAPVGYWLDKTLIIDDGQSVKLSMGSIFHDPDGDALTYTAESANTATVTVSVSGGPANLVDGVNSVLGSRMEPWLRTVGSTATLVAGVNTEGITHVTVTATDPGGLSDTVTILVYVVRYYGACSVGMVLGPREACSVGSDRFSVWHIGYATFGCCNRSLHRIYVGQFIANRIPRSDFWRIDSVP